MADDSRSLFERFLHGQVRPIAKRVVHRAVNPPAALKPLYRAIFETHWGARRIGHSNHESAHDVFKRSLRPSRHSLGAAELGVPLRTRRMPTWMLRVAGWFSPLMRELPEMQYQFEAPFVMADARARALLDMQPTPLEEQIRATATWIKASEPA